MHAQDMLRLEKIAEKLGKVPFVSGENFSSPTPTNVHYKN